MDDSEYLARQFEGHRIHLRAVAYRMLGSVSEADDAVQEAWLRLNRSDADGIENLAGWLTTVVARVSLDMLRARKSRREEPLGPHVPEPIVSREDGVDPEHEALLGDSVGLALIVVLETLDPAERLAFVLHDMFAVPFDEIAPIVGRSPAAARGGDFEALIELLDPDIVVRVDRGALPPGASTEIRGARAVAERARGGARLAHLARPALVNGAAGLVVAPRGRPLAVVGFTVAHGRIAEIDVLADPARVRQLDLTFLDI